MKYINVGILAHVDAGKTTLSEAMLLKCGEIRNAGRVDNGDAFLDTYELEKKRGITIFSKQALLHVNDTCFTLLDTPGHVDFSAEMERTLQVLDLAILLISGADGIQGHTRTLWRLLTTYRVPTIIFVNKMDQPGTDREEILAQCKKELSGAVVDFSDRESEAFMEDVAMCREEYLERVLEGGYIETDEIRELVMQRELFPCLFGSALRIEGVTELLQTMETFSAEPDYGSDFGARVFKISRDDQGNRLTFCKITGGRLKVRTLLSGVKKAVDDKASAGNGEDPAQEDVQELWQEKISQIRIYNGAKFETTEQVTAGQICALLGLSGTYPGQGLGAQEGEFEPLLEPVMTYQVLLPPDLDAAQLLPKLRSLEEELPELHIAWNERLKEIHVQIMGEVQLEILKSLAWERFRADIGFGTGNIVYKETIKTVVEGVGHFEPLRHYAEVHLILEPLDQGSGLVFAADCSEDLLDRNWQRLVLTHLEERRHKGVLTGSVITDMKITLVSGKAHLKHTMGGDFRQATYRAVRQGLMQAESVLLEPWYAFTLELPEQMIGRAMTDIDRMHGTIEPPEIENGRAILRGQAPVACLQGYQMEVTAYSKGDGHLSCVLKGYGPCHNTEEVLEQKKYDPEADLRNTADSVFCAHGAGYVVPWYQVHEMMHLESALSGARSGYVLDMQGEAGELAEGFRPMPRQQEEKAWVGTEEIDAILEKTFYANSKGKVGTRKWSYSRNDSSSLASTVSYGGPSADHSAKKKNTPGGYTEYLLVDGYNIIFAWEELNSLAAVNIDSARGALLDILCNYQAVRHCELIAVFDAYRVKGHDTEISDYQNIHVVYTREAETADRFIEKFAHENSKKYNVRVATSDGLEQIIIRGQGAALVSARELREEINYMNENLKSDFLEKQSSGKAYMMDGLSEEEKSRIAKYLEGYREESE